MKKKKGSKSGKKKKKSGKKSSEEDKIDGPDADPTTLISGNEPGAEDGKKKKKKKGKGKKKKVSKSEKALEKLEKSVEKLKAREDFYDTFICRMHKWLVDKASLAIEMFKNIDSDEGLLSYDEFKAGLFDLGAPVNKIEAHLLCKLLDEDDSGEIDYTDLEKGLQYAREIKELEKERRRDERQLLMTERKFTPCVFCKMSIVEPWLEPLPRFIALEMRSVTFDMYRDYPGHLELLVHSHTPICGLIQIIIAETDISSTKINIFRDRSLSDASVLDLGLTLEDCGFPGDSQESPEEVVLYYDYKVEFKDCPILMCDHYFGQKLII